MPAGCVVARCRRTTSDARVRGGFATAVWLVCARTGSTENERGGPNAKTRSSTSAERGTTPWLHNDVANEPRYRGPITLRTYLSELARTRKIRAKRAAVKKVA